LAVVLFIILPPDKSSVTKVANICRGVAKLVSIVGVSLEVHGRSKFLVAQETKSRVVWIAS
jgi:CO dehydrogenase/acetyl-CoA synthase beta subunit